MSTLAGALDDTRDSLTPVQDVDMQNPALDDDDGDDDGEDQSRQPDEDAEMGDGDLFGEEEDDAAGTEPSTNGEETDGLTREERIRRQQLEYNEDDQEPATLAADHALLEAVVSIPNFPVPKSSDDQYWVLRLPNFLKMDHKPFHPDTYIGPEQEEELASASQDRDMVIKLRVENTIRWRWTKDATGQDRRQSNARIIRWSDGTSSLRLGKEYFDMTHVLDTSGSAHRQAFGAASGSAPPPGAGKSHGLTYLVAQHKRAELLQAEAAIAGHIALRPTDMASDTHRLLVRAVGQKHSKTSRLGLTSFDQDKKLRAEAQASEKSSTGKRRSRPRMEGESEAAPRRRRSSGAARRRASENLWSDDDDEEEPEYEGSDEEGSPKKRRTEERERRGAGEYQTDDFLVDDDEDDAGPTGRKRAHEPTEEDELERAEQALEARKRGGEGDGDEDGDGEMDIESEEEDEEVRVRRSHAGARKRRAIEEEEEGEEE